MLQFIPDTPELMPVEVLWDIDQLAAFLHKSRATIYSDLIRRPHALPPRVAIPGSNRVLFRDPPRWAAQFVRQTAAPSAEPTEPAPKPHKRGAPTKADRLRKQAGESK